MMLWASFLASLLGQVSRSLSTSVVEFGCGGGLRLHRTTYCDAFGEIIVATFDFEQHAALTVVMDVGFLTGVDPVMRARQTPHLAFDFVFPLLERRAFAAWRRLLPQVLWRLRAGACGQLLRQVVQR